MSEVLRQSFTPASRAEWLELRKFDVTSTEVSALFGMSKYMTAYELALVKAGEVEDQFKESERSAWGNALEEAIARRVSLVYGVDVRKKTEYMRVPRYGMGASFDYEITDFSSILDPKVSAAMGAEAEHHVLRVMTSQHGPGLLEIKNVDSRIFRDEWVIGDQPEAPAHIEIQLQQQLYVSDRAWGVIAALEGGNRLHLIVRFAGDAVAMKLAGRIEAFWENLHNGIYPDPAHPDDNWIMRKLYAFAEPGKLLDAKGDKAPPGMLELMREYRQHADAERAAKDLKETAHAKLLELIGDHDRVITDIGTIACASVPEAEVSYTRKPYRAWKLTLKEAANAAKED